MKIRKLNNKGMAWTWIIICISFMFVILVYVVFDSVVQDHIVPIANEMGVDESQTNLLIMFWKMFPFVFFFALFLYGILRAMINEPYSRGW